MAKKNINNKAISNKKGRKIGLKISAVIPLYNKEQYIRRAVESAINQRNSVDEIIVVDDGSTDNGARVVNEIYDERIRLIHQQNAGEGAARNRGIAEARNSIVAFLDADDEWKPDFISHIVKLVESFPDCGIYATAFETLQFDGNIFKPIIKEIPPEPWIGILPNYFKIAQSAMPFFPSSTAVNKHHCLNEGGFPVGVKRGADLMMWIKMGIKYPIAYSSSFQVIYHTEAENRACAVYLSNDQAAHCTLMEQLIDNNEVPDDLLPDVLDYYASQQIVKAKELLKAGYSEKSRYLLEKVKGNKKYNLKISLLYLMSFIPRDLFLRLIKSSYFRHG